MRKSLEGIIGRLDITEDNVSKFGVIKILHIKKQGENKKQNKNCKKKKLSLWDNFKWHNICVTEVPKGEQETKNLFVGIIKLMRMINSQVLEAKESTNMHT